MGFWNSAGFSLFLCQCKAPLSPVLFGFLVTWDVTFSHVTFCRITRGPRRTAHYVRSKVERSRACAPLTTKKSMRFGFFRACAFLAIKTKSYGFFWQCKWYNKKPRFFANVNGPTVSIKPWYNYYPCFFIPQMTQPDLISCNTKQMTDAQWLQGNMPVYWPVWVSSIPQLTAK